MNSRERTFLALAHKNGDRIPIDFWATPTVIRRLERFRNKPHETFLDDYDVDFRYIEGPAYVGPPLPPGTDIWGVERKPVAIGYAGQAESYSETTVPPLRKAQSATEVEAYPHWPNPDMFDYEGIEQQCDAILKKNRVVVFMGDRLNRIAQLKPAMYLRGTEDIFVDLAIRQDIAETILRKIRDFYTAYLENILRAANGKIDIVLTGDDFGTQNGLLVGADMWRNTLQPGFADYLGLIRSHKTRSMHHTCGSVTEIIPDMIACGLDILQSVQPEAKGMAIGDLKRDFGRQICFQGGVSIQKTLPYGSVSDIRQEVAALANIAKPGGGYIFCTSHNIQADTPTETILALMDAYHKFGRL